MFLLPALVEKGHLSASYLNILTVLEWNCSAPPQNVRETIPFGSK